MKPYNKIIIFIVSLIVIIFLVISTLFYLSGKPMSYHLTKDQYFKAEISDDTFNMTLEITERIRPRNIFDFEGRKNFKYSDMRSFISDEYNNISIHLPVFSNKTEIEEFSINHSNEYGTSIAVLDADNNGYVSKGDVFYIYTNTSNMNHTLFEVRGKNEQIVIYILMAWGGIENKIYVPAINNLPEAVIMTYR